MNGISAKNQELISLIIKIADAVSMDAIEVAQIVVESFDVFHDELSKGTPEKLAEQAATRYIQQKCNIPAPISNSTDDSKS